MMTCALCIIWTLIGLYLVLLLYGLYLLSRQAMTELELLQQLVHLQGDIEACQIEDRVAAEWRDRWAARLADLITRRTAGRDVLRHQLQVKSAPRVR